jgi:UDP-2-acetamido-2-deoxy-ribo-hexuluronate aminotransferase
LQHKNSDMRNIQMVDLQGQYQKIKPEIDAAIDGVVRSCYFVGGPKVKSFSENLAHYLDVKEVIPCANGTDALQIALMALDLQPGDEVITTPFTFVATSEVIALLRLKPVFVDVHPDTFNIDENLIEAAITEKTKCIIPVHLFGQGCNMEAIMKIAEKHRLFVVEDNAQAIGADYHFKSGKTQKLGTIGHIGCTSFFPSKNLGCYGDGGAISTNDESLAAKIRMICNHGSNVRYYHDEIGVNSRLDSIQAAVLDVKLKYLDEYGKARQKAAAYYSTQLKGIEGVETPVIGENTTHVFHQYTLLFEEGRDEIVEALKAKGIASGVYYPVPLHLQKAYRGDGYKEGDFPVAEDLSKKVISLPMHTELTEQTQLFILEEMLKAHKTHFYKTV